MRRRKKKEHERIFSSNPNPSFNQANRHQSPCPSSRSLLSSIDPDFNRPNSPKNDHEKPVPVVYCRPFYNTDIGPPLQCSCQNQSILNAEKGCEVYDSGRRKHITVKSRQGLRIEIKVLQNPDFAVIQPQASNRISK
ncbi:hypothetical protein Ancab_040476 [Ancistrocladus abbreviatus]